MHHHAQLGVIFLIKNILFIFRKEEYYRNSRHSVYPLKVIFNSQYSMKYDMAWNKLKNMNLAMILKSTFLDLE